MKNLISNVLAWVFLIGGAVNAYLETLCAECEINVWTLVMAILAAVIAYFTGKTQNLKGKAE